MYVYLDDLDCCPECGYKYSKIDNPNKKKKSGIMVFR